MQSPRPTSVNGVTPLVGIPWERTVSFAGKVHPWIVGLAQQGFAFASRGYGRADVTRNEYAEELGRQTAFTHLVMLDLDHVHSHEVVMQLCASVAESPDRQVVAALSFRRGEPYEPLAYRREGDYMAAVLAWEAGEVLEVDAAGTGAIIIAREVFEILPWPWFKYEYPERGSYPTEDVYFCRQCREYSIPLHVDTRIRNDHLTTVGVNEQFFRGYLAAAEKQEG